MFMASPDTEQSLGRVPEEDVLPTPRYEVIPEIKDSATGQPSSLAVIDGTTVEGSQTQFIFVENLPLNLRSSTGFKEAAIWATIINFCSGIEVRYGKPINTETYLKSEQETVPVLEDTEDAKVGLYVERGKLPGFLLIEMGILAPDKLLGFLNRNLSTKDGQVEFEKIVRKIVLPTMPRFYRQLPLSLPQ